MSDPAAADQLHALSRRDKLALLEECSESLVVHTFAFDADRRVRERALAHPVLATAVLAPVATIYPESGALIRALLASDGPHYRDRLVGHAVVEDAERFVGLLTDDLGLQHRFLGAYTSTIGAGHDLDTTLGQLWERVAA